MSELLFTNKSDLVAIADSIRTKAGISGSLSFPQGFVDGINGIGGQGGNGGSDDGTGSVNYANQLYEYYGVDKSVYPYMMFRIKYNKNNTSYPYGYNLVFFSTIANKIPQPYLIGVADVTQQNHNYYFPQYTDFEKTIDSIKNTISKKKLSSSYVAEITDKNTETEWYIYYTNFDYAFNDSTLYRLDGGGNNDSGSGSTSGSASLNIHYGDNAPSDTSMLWCKCAKPTSVKASTNVNVGNEKIVNNIGVNIPQEYGSCRVSKGSKIYLFGGEYINTISVIDTETNTIETLSVTLPVTKLSLASGVVIGTKIYVFGGKVGSTAQNAIYVFDIETNTIEKLSIVLPQSFMEIGACAVGKTIYMFGGKVSTNGSPYSNICKFNTETNTIEKLSVTLPVALSEIEAVSIGTKIYLFGGATKSGTVNTIYVFDTETNIIETLSTTLPSNMASIGSGSIGTKIYLFGGRFNASTGVLNTIHVFDTETNTINTLSTTLLEALHDIGVCVIGTTMYLVGGQTSGGFSNSSTKTTVNTFNLSFELSHNSLYLQTSMFENLFNFINDDVQVELGVKSVYIGNSDGQSERVDSYLYQNDTWTQI